MSHSATTGGATFSIKPLSSLVIMSQTKQSINKLASVTLVACLAPPLKENALVSV